MDHLSRAHLNLATRALLERMKLAVLDKQRVLDYIKGDQIIELGCAGGNIISLILKKFPNAHITGIDYNSDLIEIAKQNNPKGAFFVRDIANWKDIDLFFGKYSTVIMSSFLHEVEAYNDDVLTRNVIKQAVKLLTPGGQVIFRDGVKPNHTMITFSFTNSRIQSRLLQFQRLFVAHPVQLTKQSGFNTYVMNSWDFHDFLCKYYFDKALWKKDLKERFGYYTKKGYISLFSQFITVTHSEDYIAPYLASRWQNDFVLLKGKFPSSHILLIGQKKGLSKSE